MMDAGSTVKLNFQLTKDEMIKAHRQYMRIRRAIEGYGSIIRYALLVLVAFVAVWVLFNFESMILLVFFVALFALRSVLNAWYPSHKIGRQVSQFLQEMSIIITKDEIDWKIADHKQDVEWGQYSGIWQSDDFFFFIRERHEYFGVPRRAFASAEDIQVFKEMAAANSIKVRNGDNI